MSAPGGKVAVITGASGAVGRAVARQVARYAEVLCLLGRDAVRLEAAGRDVEAAGSQAVQYAADFIRDGDVRHLADEIGRRFRQVDVLVHCAGAIDLGSVGEAPVEQFDLQYLVNVRAPFLLTQALLPLITRCAGQIVFVNSTAGLIARPQTGQYAATKHALKAVADSLRDEVNAAGVRVLSVFLGRTASPMQEFVHRYEGRPYQADRLMQPDDVAAMILHALSLPRTAEVTELRMRPLMKPAGQPT